MNVNNPYSTHDKAGMPQNQLEASILIKYASSLNQIKENWDEKKSELDGVLEANRKVWTILVDDMASEENKLPIEIKNNMMNLALFIFQRTMDILLTPTPESLDSLININMNIAKGLNETPDK